MLEFFAFIFDYLEGEIQNIYEKDPSMTCLWEVIFFHPGFHIILFHNMAHFLWMMGLKFMGKSISNLGRLLTGIEIHPNVKIGNKLLIDHGYGVVIGETVTIGNNCTLFQGVTLGGKNIKKGVKRHPTISDNVLIGAGAKVIGSILIGKNAKVGCNAVVLHDVPDNSTVVGIPATPLLVKKTDFESLSKP